MFQLHLYNCISSAVFVHFKSRHEVNVPYSESQY